MQNEGIIVKKRPAKNLATRKIFTKFDGNKLNSEHPKCEQEEKWQRWVIETSLETEFVTSINPKNTETEELSKTTCLMLIKQSKPSSFNKRKTQTLITS